MPIPLGEYASFRTFDFQRLKQAGPWDVMIRNWMYGSISPGWLASFGDVIPLYDSHALEILTQAQPRDDGSKSSATLWGILFTFFDP